MMKTIFIPNKSMVASAVFAMLAAALLLVHAPVQAVSTSMQVQAANKEVEDLVKKINQEIDRRLKEMEKASEGLAKSNNLPADVKMKIQQLNAQVTEALKALKKEAAKVKTVEQAKALGKKVDEQYATFRTANASSKLSTNLNSQQDIQKSIEARTNDIQKIIEEAKTQSESAQNGGSMGSGGGGMTGAGDFKFDPAQAEQMLQQLKDLAASAAAIIASIAALLAALASGDFAGAMAIFATILGQLGVAQGMQGNALGGLINLGGTLTAGTGSFQAGGAS